MEYELHCTFCIGNSYFTTLSVWLVLEKKNLYLFKFHTCFGCQQNFNKKNIKLLLIDSYYYYILNIIVI